MRLLSESSQGEQSTNAKHLLLKLSYSSEVSLLSVIGPSIPTPNHPYLQSCLFVITTIISGGGCLVPQPGHKDKVLTVESGN